MSEYQYVAFRAVDAPVSKTNLAYMRRQSTRAEITPWSFENEYHFGDFHGNAAAMLRRGYDFHFHYANFGIRNLMIRLPSGLPDPKAAQPYFKDDSLHLLKDKQGPAGILCINPYFEPEQQDDLWEFDGLVDRLLPLRAEILDGDLRPLYLAHLAAASDSNHDPDEEKDAPAPAGLHQLTDAQRALTKLYGLSKALIAAAARNSPPLPESAKPDPDYAAWLQRQPDATRLAWLHQLMANPRATVRSEILAEYQKSRAAASWPTVHVDRTIADLWAAAEGIQDDMNRQRAAETARRRAKKLAHMAADPSPTLHETEELLKQRNIEACRQIGLLLADLREALSGTAQSALADQHARKLKDGNPTRRHLIGELRRRGFLTKSSE